MTCPGCAWPWIHYPGQGADDMTLEKVSDYVTCGELIDRLGCLTIEFVKGIQRGIVPKPKNEAGDARTAETDPAFYDHSLMPSVDEWVKYVRAAKIFRFFAESSWPRMRHELGHCWKVVETATTPPTPTTEPDHDQQQVEEKEPTDAAPYIKWRRAKVGSIHNGQLMLEVQGRWGKPPEKTMDRAEIAALVRGEEPPSPNDTARRQSLENAFKYETNQYKKRLKN